MLYKRYTPNGINVDVDGIDLPDDVWTDGLNMVPRVGKMERALGYQPIFPTPLFPPFFLMSTPQLGAPSWIYGGTNELAVINSAGAHSDGEGRLSTGGLQRMSPGWCDSTCTQLSV